METDFLAVTEEAKALNSDVFSLTRLQLLANLAVTGQDGASYRELKAWLGLSDGALYSNMDALEKMGYVKSEKVEFEGKELKAYTLTAEGMTEWARVRNWLHKFIGCEGRK
ncbi:transcriptional regulator [Candidatus Micrarchaeota archaeon]|nr:transcriptional regulator [Candidatus Micrarchaeota archaeon]